MQIYRRGIPRGNTIFFDVPEATDICRWRFVGGGQSDAGAVPGNGKGRTPLDAPRMFLPCLAFENRA